MGIGTMLSAWSLSAMEFEQRKDEIPIAREVIVAQSVSTSLLVGQNKRYRVLSIADSKIELSNL